MKNFFLVGALVFTFGLNSVSCGLYCWMCGNGGGTSFHDCDTRRIKQNCSEPRFQEAGKGPLNRCAYFSYSLEDKKRIYAKSCTFASYCTKSGDVFCDNVRGGAKHCQVECCENDMCNADDQFKVVKTWPTPTPYPNNNNTVTDDLWCDWKESDADNNAQNVQNTSFLFIVIACVFSAWIGLIFSA